MCVRVAFSRAAMILWAWRVVQSGRATCIRMIEMYVDVYATPHTRLVKLRAAAAWPGRAIRYLYALFPVRSTRDGEASTRALNKYVNVNLHVRSPSPPCTRARAWLDHGARPSCTGTRFALASPERVPYYLDVERPYVDVLTLLSMCMCSMTLGVRGPTGTVCTRRTGRLGDELHLIIKRATQSALTLGNWGRREPYVVATAKTAPTAAQSFGSGRRRGGGGG